MDDQKLKMPQVGEYLRNTGRLVAVQEIPPEPQKKRQDYIFEEISADIELVFNGEVLKNLGSLNDFYGLETSVKSAIADAKSYATEKCINENSELEVRVVRIVEQYRARPTKRELFYAKGYAEFKPIEFGMSRDLPKHKRKIVWSSKKNLKGK